LSSTGKPPEGNAGDIHVWFAQVCLELYLPELIFSKLYFSGSFTGINFLNALL